MRDVRCIALLAQFIFENLPQSFGRERFGRVFPYLHKHDAVLRPGVDHLALPLETSGLPRDCRTHFRQVLVYEDIMRPFQFASVSCDGDLGVVAGKTHDDIPQHILLLALSTDSMRPYEIVLRQLDVQLSRGEVFDEAVGVLVHGLRDASNSDRVPPRVLFQVVGLLLQSSHSHL